MTMTPAERNENRRLFDAYQQREADIERRRAAIEDERSPLALSSLGGDQKATQAIAALDKERLAIDQEAQTLRDALRTLDKQWTVDLPLQAAEHRAERLAEARTEVEALLGESAEIDKHLKLAVAALGRRADRAARLAHVADLGIPPLQPLVAVFDSALGAAGMTGLDGRFRMHDGEPNTFVERDVEQLRIVLDPNHPEVRNYNRIIDKRNAEMRRADERSREGWNDRLPGRAMPVDTPENQLAALLAARPEHDRP